MKTYNDYTKKENGNWIYNRKTPSPLNKIYPKSHLRYPLKNKTEGKEIHTAIEESNILAGLTLIPDNVKIREIGNLLSKDNGLSIEKDLELKFKIDPKVDIENVVLSDGCVLMDLNRWMSHMLTFKEKMSPLTKRQYEKTFEEFFEYIKQSNVEKLVEIKANTLKGYIHYKKGLGVDYTENSLQTFLGTIKGLLKYITMNNDDDFSFLAESKKYEIRPEKTFKDGLTVPEQKRLLNKLNSKNVFGTEKEKTIIYRNRLLVKLGLFCGLRAAEILMVKFDMFEEIGDGQYRANIIGKGLKRRNLYIEISDIKEELEFLKPKYKEFVAETKNGNVMDRKGLYNVSTKMMESVGIKKTGVHVLRHTYAENLVREGVNTSTIKDLLGHASITTTDIYAQADENGKSAASRKAVVQK